MVEEPAALETVEADVECEPEAAPMTAEEAIAMEEDAPTGEEPPVDEAEAEAEAEGAPVGDEAAIVDFEGPEPARIPTSLTATLREQGPRYQHRVSRRMRRRGRGDREGGREGGGREGGGREGGRDGRDNRGPAPAASPRPLADRKRGRNRAPINANRANSVANRANSVASSASSVGSSEPGKAAAIPNPARKPSPPPSAIC